ncbi:hypothetical protein GWI33_011994 [Rhynchophorus ferrugineus]|uniref:Uncharacterized protein n=1 Tax=Rhynchophorus ferrugineus TaxID=354439 RepID=A0A834IWD1_RHYFE|nr:hypothetical protein GWI33_011994 [Rhynchophorus ferrugineus]
MNFLSSNNDLRRGKVSHCLISRDDRLGNHPRVLKLLPRLARSQRKTYDSPSLVHNFCRMRVSDIQASRDPHPPPTPSRKLLRPPPLEPPPRATTQ